jgi:hypothetical protein
MGRHGRDTDDEDENDTPQDTDDEVHRGVSAGGRGQRRDDEDDD